MNCCSLEGFIAVALLLVLGHADVLYFVILFLFQQFAKAPV